MNVQEFAKLAGVTVRALHHYDRLGLLRARRNGTGYRVYAACDMERLEQIVALKFLGIPLKQIGTMLDPGGLELSEALRMQRTVLEEKRQVAGSRHPGDRRRRGIHRTGTACRHCVTDENHRGDRNAKRQ